MSRVHLDKDQLSEIVKQVIAEYNKQQQEKTRSKRDRRFHNTELLLKNYNGLIKHYNDAICSQKQIEAEDPESVFEEIEDEVEMDDISDYDVVYISSIKRTRTRTKIIIKHIDSAMSYYKYQAENSKDINFVRRYRTIELLYFEDKTWEETAEELHCSKKTIGRDKKTAVEELSVLFFGIDGLKFYV